MTRPDARYPALEQEFIVGGDEVTLRYLAKREGMRSNSPISDYAKAHDWKGKRQRFREKSSDDFINKSAIQRAERLAILADRSLDVVQAILVQAAQRIVAGNLDISAKDALDAITKVQLLRGEATERTEGRTVNAHVLDARSLDILEELARGKLGPSPVGGDKPKLLTG